MLIIYLLLIARISLHLFKSQHSYIYVIYCHFLGIINGVFWILEIVFVDGLLTAARSWDENSFSILKFFDPVN